MVILRSLDSLTFNPDIFIVDLLWKCPKLPKFGIFGDELHCAALLLEQNNVVADPEGNRQSGKVKSAHWTRSTLRSVKFSESETRSRSISLFDRYLLLPNEYHRKLSRRIHLTAENWIFLTNCRIYLKDVRDRSNQQASKNTPNVSLFYKSVPWQIKINDHGTVSRNLVTNALLRCQTPCFARRLVGLPWP